MGSRAVCQGGGSWAGSSARAQQGQGLSAGTAGAALPVPRSLPCTSPARGGCGSEGLPERAPALGRAGQREPRNSRAPRAPFTLPEPLAQPQAPAGHGSRAGYAFKKKFSSYFNTPTSFLWPKKRKKKLKITRFSAEASPEIQQ